MIENPNNEPVVTFEYLQHTHVDEIRNVTQAADVRAMIHDLRVNIKQSLKHETPFLGINVAKEKVALDVLETVAKWFYESGDYNVTLDDV